MPFRSPHPDVVIPPVALTDYVLGGIDDHRDRPALVDGVSGRTITFGELAEGVRRLAAGLSRRGIGKGDVVAIWAPNLPDYAIVFHAVSRLGAILTTANPVYTAEELAFQLGDAGARVLVTTGALLERASREGVTYTPGRYFEVTRSAAGALRLSFAGLGLEEIRVGVETLGRIFKDEAARSASSRMMDPSPILV